MIGEGKRLKVKGERAVVSGQLSAVGAHGCAPSSDTKRPGRWLIWCKNIGVWLVIVGTIGFIQSMILMSKSPGFATDVPASVDGLFYTWLFGMPLGGLLVLVSGYPGSQVWKASWVRKPRAFVSICYVFSWTLIPALGIQLIAPFLMAIPLVFVPWANSFFEFVTLFLLVWVLLSLAVASFYILLLVKHELLFPSMEEARRIIDRGGIKLHWTTYVTLASVIAGMIGLSLVESDYINSLVLIALVWAVTAIGFIGVAILHSPFVKQVLPQLERVRKQTGYFVLYPLVLAWLALDGLYMVHGGDGLATATLWVLGLALAAAVGTHIEYLVRNQVQSGPNETNPENNGTGASSAPKTTEGGARV